MSIWCRCGGLSPLILAHLDLRGRAGTPGGRQTPVDTVHVFDMSENISAVSPLETLDAEQLCALLHISMRTLNDAHVKAVASRR